MPRRQNNLTRRVNRLETVSRPEVKHLGDQSTDFDTIGSNSGTLIRPQALDQGSARNQRVGDKVKSRNIRFQAILKMPNAPANATCAVRILVLRCKMQDPVTGDMPDWYETVDEDKFFVIKDVLTQVSTLQGSSNEGTTVLSGSTLKKLKFNIPCGLRKMQYDGSGSGNLHPLNNEYVIFMFAENQSAEVAYNYQHYYIDN